MLFINENVLMYDYDLWSMITMSVIYTSSILDTERMKEMVKNEIYAVFTNIAFLSIV